MSVLLVEDDESIAIVITAALEAEGLPSRAVTASPGAIACWSSGALPRW
jgi:CheY-like chemotaxis protein